MRRGGTAAYQLTAWLMRPHAAAARQGGGGAARGGLVRSALASKLMQCSIAQSRKVPRLAPPSPVLWKPDRTAAAPGWPVRAAIWLPLTALLSVVLLPPIKGATVGVMLRLGLLKGEDET